ncbi:hypothetical protein WN51_06454 [Melipona quadrifasciata]|uniref:Uncharacterized protein n=1 Tax=Melipona quadrifasciata TaxID=166423 RepID=A0A0M9A9M8_9HYME|nr:hypothetical protein WN51_06454 [Melipona quadrifasciata]
MTQMAMIKNRAFSYLPVWFAFATSETRSSMNNEIQQMGIGVETGLAAGFRLVLKTVQRRRPNFNLPSRCIFKKKVVRRLEALPGDRASLGATLTQRKLAIG